MDLSYRIWDAKNQLTWLENRLSKIDKKNVPTVYAHALQKYREYKKKLVRLLDMQKSHSEKVTRYAQLITDNCQPYLRQISYDVHKILYRGMSVDMPAFTKQRRIDRKPRDTDIYLHDALNSYFEKHFRHPYRQAVFATGSKHVASEYGIPYAIYPVGEFEYLWSPDVHDFTQFFDEDVDLDKLLNLQGDAYNNYVYSILDEIRFKTTDLTDAIASGHEIMLWCDEYYVVNDVLLNELVEKLQERIQK